MGVELFSVVLKWHYGLNRHAKIYNPQHHIPTINISPIHSFCNDYPFLALLLIFSRQLSFTSMLKKQQPLDDHTLTEPETPPSLQHHSPHNSHSSSQLIQRIISSNQELIHQQMNSIRVLQRHNAELEDELKLLREKYGTLVEICIENGFQGGEMKGEERLGGKGRRLSLDDLLKKIVELEQKLSMTKVELAVKSAELLTTNFQHNQEDSNSKRRLTMNSDSSKEQIQQYRYIQPAKEHESGKKNSADSKELVQAWSKLYDQYGIHEHKIHRFKEKSTSLIKKFVPKELRGKVWAICIENKLGMTNALYIQLLQRRAKGWVCEKVRIQIDKDIKRSFYGKTNYQTKTGIILEVVEFLEIFHIFRPDISYIQGMTYPAMILIPILGKIKAFNLFCNLILGNPFFRKLFSMQGNFISTLCRGFELLLAEYFSELSQKMAEMGIQAQIYLIQWLFTLFSRGLSIQTTLKFWDHLLFFQELAIFRLSLAIFQQLGPIILQLNYQQTVNFIRQYPSNIKQDKLLESLASSKLTTQRLLRTFQRVKL